MTASAETPPPRRGSFLLTGGFRPFFLFGAVWAALAVALWLPLWEGRIDLPTALSPVDWHVHELLWGYGGAAVAGFLLTAVPSWTGRPPVAGRPLAALVGLWAIGRLAILASAVVGPLAAAILDVAFFVALAAVAAREIVASGNRRNLKVVALIAVLALADVVFHVETIRFGTAAYGLRLGIAALIGLVVVIGGRIVPNFTLNWLRRRPPGRLPVAFSRFDAIVAAVTGAVLLLWTIVPEGPITGVTLVATGLLHLARLARWAGWRTWDEKLVFVLHVAHLFVPLGFLLLGASLLGLPLAPSAALHAWTIGAVGLTTLAVMTRATLGHTGRPLHAGAKVVALYAGVVVAALARIAVGFGHGELVLLHVAALGWLVGFAGFALVHRPILLGARAS